VTVDARRVLSVLNGLGLLSMDPRIREHDGFKVNAVKSGAMWPKGTSSSVA
jgi:hypothetical protein